MLPLTKSEETKTALLTLETQIQAASKRGPTILTIYLENFCCKLLEIYYGYKFFNLNYETKNIKGIDLFNVQYNHAIQITCEKNNSEKVIKSIKNIDKYNMLSVFFFDHNKTTTISKNVKEKGYNPSNLQIISLANIFDDIEQNADKIEQYYTLCKLWISGDVINQEDFVEILNKEANKKISSNITSKKYIPEIYIPEFALKKSCRLFSCPTLAEQLLFFTAPSFYKGSKYNNLKNVIAITDKGEKIDFIKDCCIDNLIEKDIPSAEDIELMLDKLKAYEQYASISNGSGAYAYKDGKEVSYDEKHSKFESSVKYEIGYLLKDFNISQKKYYFIVKDAGQGKTSFLCDFCSSVLFKRRIPTVFINVNQITGSLLEYFKNIISNLFGKDYMPSITLLKQYLSAINRNLLVVIDGLNESTKGMTFKNEVLEFINHIDNLEFIKMITTTRHAAYDLYYKSFFNESFGNKITVDIERIYGMGERKSSEFKTKILKKYRDYFKVSCYISKTAQKKLSNDTLLLRIFCEVFECNSTAVVNDIFLYKLFKEYIEKRARQLLSIGKIKRIEDLMSLFKKISNQMLSKDNLDNFTADGFSSEEKDLLDTIVEEDILIKTIDEKNILLFNDTIYSFTYDEFRDFLLSMVLLAEKDDNIFSRRIIEYSKNYSRYDGLLKYLFLFCKNTKNIKITALKRLDNYTKLYSANIFSVDDDALSDEDVNIIVQALKTNQEALFYEICKRLNLEEYKKLSIFHIVQYYVKHYLNRPMEWINIFVKNDIYMNTKRGVLISILNEKYCSTYHGELKGILLFLSTFTYSPCLEEEDYLMWLNNKYPYEILKLLECIKMENPELKQGCERLKGEVKRLCK